MKIKKIQVNKEVLKINNKIKNNKNNKEEEFIVSNNKIKNKLLFY